MRCYLFTSSCSLAAIIAVVAILGHGVTVADGAELIDVGVYYESLCGDSMRFINNQLVPSYEALKNYISITFVPYGKASHTKDGENGWKFSCQHGPDECEGNMAQACAIHAIQNEEQAENVQQLTVSLVGCAMSSRYPPSSVPRCAKQAGVSEKTRKAIDSCIADPLSKELLVMNGEKTKALNPKLSFVPTITVKGVTSPEIQKQALTNFLKLICDQLPEDSKPSQCGNA